MKRIWTCHLLSNLSVVIKKLKSQQLSLFFILVVIILLHQLNADAVAAVQIYKHQFSSLAGWKTNGSVHDKIDIAIVDAPKGTLSTVIPLLEKQNEMVVLQAEIKLTGIRLGERNYQAPRFVLQTSGAEVNQRTPLWIRSAGENWRIISMAMHTPTDSNSLSVAISNNSLSGEFAIRNITVWTIKKEELENFDYPKKWQQVLKTTQVPRTARLFASDFKTLNKKLYGFNSRYYSTHMTVEELLNHSKVKEVQPFVARFPGGTISNFYHWECDCLNPLDLDSFPKYEAQSWYKYLFTTLNKAGSIGQKDVGAWNAKNDIAMTLVLNPLFEESANSMAGFAELMRSTGTNVKFAEMGNELYNDGQRGNIMPNAEDYFEKVRRLTHGLKQVIPDLLVGLPYSSEDKEWNNSLAKADINYDGIILHLYANTSPIASIEEDLYLLTYPYNVISPLLESMRNLFPGKQFWITEWGILDRPLLRRNNSQTGILFSANMLTFLMRQPDISLACFHSLFDPHFGLFRFLIDATPDKFLDNKNLSFQYSFWKTMRSLFEQYKETAKIEVIDPNGKTIIDQNVIIQAFQGQGKGALMAINNSQSPCELTIEGVDIAKFDKRQAFIHPDAGQLNDIGLVVPSLSVIILEGTDAAFNSSEPGDGVIVIKKISLPINE